MNDYTKIGWKVAGIILKYRWLDAKARWGCRFRRHKPWKMASYGPRIGWICSCGRRWWPTRDDITTFIDLPKTKKREK